MNPKRFLPTRLGKRATAFMLAAAVTGAPAATLRLLCVGGSCETPAQASAFTPFCSLPEEMRRKISVSTRDGRSGDLLAVSKRDSLVGGSAFARSPLLPRWPSLERPTDTVPIVMSGPGIGPGATFPADTGLDDVAPTISKILGFARPHPEVRSGEPVQAVVAGGTSPRLVVMVAWKGVGAVDLATAPDSWPHLADLMAAGAGTLEAENRSLSSDPAAALTTLGTGGVPSEHGITGSLVRNEEAELVGAWSRGSPVNVIATLAEDLDEEMDQKPVVALVGSEAPDRGLIGGDWHVEADRDLVSMLPAPSSAEAIAVQAEQLLRRTRLGRDDVPDLLAVSQQGTVEGLDRQLDRIVRAARETVGEHVLFVVAGTGSADRSLGSTDLTSGRLLRLLETAVPGRERVIEAVGPGELFLDQDLLAARGMSDEVVLDALSKLRDRSGEKLFADAFPSITVTFGRFC